MLIKDETSQLDNWGFVEGGRGAAEFTGLIVIRDFPPDDSFGLVKDFEGFLGSFSLLGDFRCLAQSVDDLFVFQQFVVERVQHRFLGLSNQEISDILGYYFLDKRILTRRVLITTLKYSSTRILSYLINIFSASFLSLSRSFLETGLFWLAWASSSCEAFPVRASIMGLSVPPFPISLILASSFLEEFCWFWGLGSRWEGMSLVLC